jgi:hypothetical protein
MKPKARVEPRRSKLPPILEIDEDGIPVADYEPWRQARWSSDEDTPGLQMDDWPAELDD